MKNKLFNILFPIISILIIVLIWLLYSVRVDNKLICPTPSETLKELFDYLKHKTFYKDLFNTLLRSIYSFLLAFIIAFLMAILSKFFMIARKLFLPFFGIVRGIPTMAILLILTFSVESANRPVVVALIVMIPLLYSLILGSFDNIDKNIIEMANLYKVSKKDIVLKIYLREISKPLFEGLATLSSFNIKLIVSAEAISMTLYSIGNDMKYSQVNLEMSKVFALTLVSILLGFLIEIIIRLVSRIIMRWEND